MTLPERLTTHLLGAFCVLRASPSEEWLIVIIDFNITAHSIKNNKAQGFHNLYTHKGQHRARDRDHDHKRATVPCLSAGRHCTGRKSHKRAHMSGIFFLRAHVSHMNYSTNLRRCFHIQKLTLLIGSIYKDLKKFSSLNIDFVLFCCNTKKKNISTITKL